MDDSRNDLLLRFFRTLADPTRLKIAGALARREASLEDLAASADLSVHGLTRHLRLLSELGLVRERETADGRRYALDLGALHTLNREVQPASPKPVGEEVEGEEWERKVLRDFFVGERLKDLPATAKKRAVVLRWLATRFAPGELYPEKQVNEIISRHHPDYASLRRELVDCGLLRRDHGVYWRP